MKCCTKCKKTRSLNRFSSYNSKKTGRLLFQSWCHDCILKISRKWKKDNKTRVKEHDALYRHTPQRKAYAKAYKKTPKYIKQQRAYRIKKRDYFNDYDRNRRKKDHNFKLRAYIRTRIYHAFRLRKIQKFNHSKELIGCTFDELKLHLEERFESWMSWENYGSGWHIDHIKPLYLFDLTKKKQREEGFHYTNMQPLEAGKNMSKNGMGDPEYKKRQKPR